MCVCTCMYDGFKILFQDQDSVIFLHTVEPRPTYICSEVRVPLHRCSPRSSDGGRLRCALSVCAEMAHSHYRCRRHPGKGERALRPSQNRETSSIRKKNNVAPITPDPITFANRTCFFFFSFSRTLTFMTAYTHTLTNNFRGCNT